MVPAVFRDLPPGIWTFEFHSGGPSGATLTNVSPSSPQTLTAGGTIAFTLNFTTTSPQTGRIIGRVVAMGTGQGIVGSLVEATGPSYASTRTVSGGNYTLTVPAGAYTLKVSADGYQPQTLYNVTVPAGEIAARDFGLYPIVTTRNLTVNSLNPNGGVSISVSPNDTGGRGSGATPFTRTYDSNTRVTLTAPATAGGNNFEKWQRNGVDWATTTTTTITMDADYTMTAVYVSPSPPGTGTIQVHATLDGKTWEGVINYFRLIGPGTWKVEGAAMVPAVFRDLPPGIWTFEFHSGGPSGATLTNVSPSSPQTLTAGGTIAFTLNFTTTSPQTGRIIGRVVAMGTGQGIVGSLVEATGPSYASTRTVSGGNYTLTVPAGAYTLKVSADGYQPQTLYNVTVPAGEIAARDFGLYPIVTTRNLTVNSLNPNGGVSISVSPNDTGGRGSGATPFTRTYDSNTRVTLTAPATAGGNNFEKWQRNGVDWATTTTTTITMDADYTMTAVYVSPSPPGTGTIQVHATLDGRTWSGSVSYRIAGPQNRDGTAVSATFPNMPTGSYTLTYQSGGPPGATRTGVTPNSTQTLTAGGTVTFTLVFATTPPTCTEGRAVDRVFFADVLRALGIGVTDFGVDALDKWKRYENTRACWNPLAATMRMEGSWDFNSVGVKNYPDRSTGIDATARTLRLGYYDAIRAMLARERFDRQQIETALNTWSGNGGYVGDLLKEWEALWSATGAQEYGSLRVTIEPADARSAGAQWRLTSGPDVGWKNSGEYIHKLPAGTTYVITFKTLSGWRTPADQSVTITTNATMLRGGTYVQELPGPQVSIVRVLANLNGNPWRGAVTYKIDGPTKHVGTSVEAEFEAVPGIYSLSYTSGGPPGADLLSITPVYPREKPTLVSGQVLTFTLHFSTQCSCWGSRNCSGQLTDRDLAALVITHFPEREVTLHDGTTASSRVVAYAIARAESQGDPGNCGDRDVPVPDYCAIGLWQINTYWNHSNEPHRLFDPDFNAQAARALSENPKGWDNFSTWKDGSSYRKFLPEATTAIAAALGQVVPSPGRPQHTYGVVAGLYLVSTPVAADAAPYGGRAKHPVTGRWENVTTIEPIRGYWVELPANKTVTITGTPITADVTIDLSTADWHQISAPWPYPKTAILVGRGSETKSWSDAVAAGWIGSVLWGFRATEGNYTPATTIDPWYGYYLKSNVPGLSLRLLYTARATTMCVTCPAVHEPEPVVFPLDLPPPPSEPPMPPGAGPSVICAPNPVASDGAAFFYYLPTGTQTAKLVVYDVGGRPVIEIPLDAAATRYPAIGRWNPVDRNGIPLANGPYVYVLIADGRVIGQGKMVIQR
ncbi:MAG: carboxypeptidase regulatory-like domain-containing protein [Candidatus Acetothermia bacterium]|nr:carboxypeptidase regulatory-like domain-containing protein [Candidatus Acetothermia bacterium]